MYKAHKSFLVITDITICHEIHQQALNNNNNQILLAYRLDAFYLYHKLAKKLLNNCGNRHGAHESFLVIENTIICYGMYQQALNNNNKKILLAHILDPFYLYHR